MHTLRLSAKPTMVYFHLVLSLSWLNSQPVFHGHFFLLLCFLILFKYSLPMCVKKSNIFLTLRVLDYDISSQQVKLYGYFTGHTLLIETSHATS